MRERAQEIIKLRHEQLICPSGAESKVKASRTQLAPLKFDVFFEPGHQCVTRTSCPVLIEYGTSAIHL